MTVAKKAHTVTWILAALIAVLPGNSAYGDSVGTHRATPPPFQLTESSLTYRSFFPGGADPLITENGLPNRALDKELALTLNIDLFRYLYWNNYVHAGTDHDIINGGGQFRTVGYQFELGVHAATWVDVGYHHHSQHLLDTTYGPGHWPVQDAIELKLYFYRPKLQGATVLPW